MESRNHIGKVENKCQRLEKSNQCLIKLIEAWPLKINDLENCSQNRKKQRLLDLTYETEGSNVKAVIKRLIPGTQGT